MIWSCCDNYGTEITPGLYNPLPARKITSSTQPTAWLRKHSCISPKVLRSSF